MNSLPSCCPEGNLGIGFRHDFHPFFPSKNSKICCFWKGMDSVVEDFSKSVRNFAWQDAWWTKKTRGSGQHPPWSAHMIATSTTSTSTSTSTSTTAAAAADAIIIIIIIIIMVIIGTLTILLYTGPAIDHTIPYQLSLKCLLSYSACLTQTQTMNLQHFSCSGHDIFPNHFVNCDGTPLKKSDCWMVLGGLRIPAAKKSRSNLISAALTAKRHKSNSPATKRRPSNQEWSSHCILQRETFRSITSFQQTWSISVCILTKGTSVFW